MIIRNDNSYVRNEMFPNSNFLGTDNVTVIDDNSELADKFIRLFPYGKIVTDDNGNVVDVVDNTPEISLSQLITQKKKELSVACEKSIILGVDVDDAHYSLTIEDQANILAWMAVAQTGKAVPYHQDGQPCRVYTAEEFLEVANAAVVHKTHHTTYCNLLMRQVEAMTDVGDVKAVQYGITQLEGEYAEQYQVIMASLMGENSETNS